MSFCVTQTALNHLLYCAVCGIYIPLSYWEHRHIYLVEACISITLTKNKPSSEKKQTSSPRRSPACTAMSYCISVASWNICFCCSKNYLFVLTITPWCFSFHFSNLSKVIIQFQVFQGSEFLETQSDHLVKAGVHIGLQSDHLWHVRGVVLEEACSLSVTCWSNMLA